MKTEEIKMLVMGLDYVDLLHIYAYVTIHRLHDLVCAFAERKLSND